jgi:hypothetical protein
MESNHLTFDNRVARLPLYDSLVLPNLILTKKESMLVTHFVVYCMS